MTIFTRFTEADIDRYDLLLVNKILVTIFMTLLLVINIAFAVTTIVRHRKSAFTQARYNVRLSLTLGGFISGAVTVQDTVTVYQDNQNYPHCSLSRIEEIYLREFVPVLYACGFSLLAVDIVVRSVNAQALANLLNRNNRLTLVPVLVLLPWILSMVVVCPLTLTEMDWSDCDSTQTEHQIKARLVLQNFFPTVIMIVVAVICSYIVSKHDKSPAQRFITPEELNNPNIVEMEIRSEPSPQGLVTQSGGFEKRPLTSDKVTVVNNLPAVASQEQDSLYTKDAMRREAWNVVVCSVVFLFTIVPYFIVCLYIIDTYRSQPYDTLVYPLQGSAALAHFISYWIKDLLPVVVPLISMTV